MHEHLPSQPNQEPVESLSLAQVVQDKEKMAGLQIDGRTAIPAQTPEAEAAERDVFITKAEIKVEDAIGDQEFTKVIDGIDFSADKFSFWASNSYHAEARTSERNTTTLGKANTNNYFDRLHTYMNPDKTKSLWGNIREEADYHKQPIEKVGIREAKRIEHVEAGKAVPAKGLRGKLGFKHTVKVQEPNFAEEPTYFFDYELATPSHGDEAAKAVGNNTGQYIGLHLELTKKQAEGLSRIIEKDPAAARSVLDVFMAKTGNAETWNAKIFDEEGKFQDPATPHETYYNKGSFAKESGHKFGKDSMTGGFLARDVRPNYDAMSSLKPEVIGTVGGKEVIGYLSKTPSNPNDALLTVAK